MSSRRRRGRQRSEVAPKVEKKRRVKRESREDEEEPVRRRSSRRVKSEGGDEQPERRRSSRRSSQSESSSARNSSPSTNEVKSSGTGQEGVSRPTEMKSASSGFSVWTVEQCLKRHCNLTRSLTKFLLAEGCVPESEFLEQYHKLGRICETYGYGLRDVLLIINAALNLVDMEVRKTRFEFDGITYIGVVAKAAPAVTELGTSLNPGQSKFVENVVKFCVDGGGYVSATDLLECAAKVPRGRLTYVSKLKAMKALVGEQMLMKVDNDNYVLGPRLQLELCGFKDYPQVRKCAGCNGKVVLGYSCDNQVTVPGSMPDEGSTNVSSLSRSGCDAICHQWCVKKVAGTPQCRKCGVKWDNASMFARKATD